MQVRACLYPTHYSPHPRLEFANPVLYAHWLTSMFFSFCTVLYARSTLVHFVRVRARQRVPGGSLGRNWSKSCGGLSAPSPHHHGSLKETGGGDGSRRTSLRNSLSRALGITKSKAAAVTESFKEKISPTSSSESSSVVSRMSPPMQYFSTTKSSKSGGESPIYAQPFMHAQGMNPNYPQSQRVSYQRRSEDYDAYICGSIDEYVLTRSSQSIRSDTNDISIKEEKMFPSLQSEKKQHRRVKSISDIDAIHVGSVK